MSRVRAEDGSGLEERVIMLTLEGPGSTLKLQGDGEGAKTLPGSETVCLDDYRAWLWLMFWLPNNKEDEQETWVKLGLEEARLLRDHLGAILTESGKSPAKTVVLGPDHEGMRIDASGVLCNNNKGSTQFRKMMLGHLQDLAQRYYAGDTGAVDDFLQTYCLGVDARKLAKERQNSAAAAEGGR